MLELSNLSQLNKNIIIAYNKGYRVSSYGIVHSPVGKIRKTRTKKNKLYLYFLLFVDGKNRLVYVHKLQAYQKFKDNLFKKEVVVRHKDGNPKNNSYENILIGTQKDNNRDKLSEVSMRTAIHASQFARVWSDDKLKEIFDDRYLRGYTYSMLRDKYGISKGHCSWTFSKSLFSKNYNSKLA